MLAILNLAVHHKLRLPFPKGNPRQSVLRTLTKGQAIFALSGYVRAALARIQREGKGFAAMRTFDGGGVVQCSPCASLGGSLTAVNVTRSNTGAVASLMTKSFSAVMVTSRRVMLVIGL